MLKSLRDLFLLLTPTQQKKLLRLQWLVLLMSLAEVASVLAIGPFMALVGDLSSLQGDGLVARIYQVSFFETPKDFLFWVGICVICILFLSTFISLYTVRSLNSYGVKVGAELSNRLFAYYANKPWVFHTTHHSSRLSKNIAQESHRITASIIRPFMQMNAKLMMVLLMSVTVFLYKPVVALVGMSVFGGSYFTLYFIARKRLVRNDKIITDAQTSRFKVMNELFGGIREVLLFRRQEYFNLKFFKASNNYASALGSNVIVGLLPRYLMELVSYGSIIFLIIYLLSSSEGNMSTMLATLSIYSLAGFKLLPAFQMIYSSIAQIKGNLRSFYTIRDDLHNSLSLSQSVKDAHFYPLGLSKTIEFCDVSFSYPGKNQPAVENLTLSLPANSVIALVGPTGSGKSTIVDLLLGLIDPTKGEIRIDGTTLTQSNMPPWQASLGFVPQSIFLADASIRDNVAFGLPEDEIDEERVGKAAKMAHLNEFVSRLPEGLDTIIGEKGVQLSGGQRQRIGIARALYNDVDVLVLDEATSALDNITEKRVMEAIRTLKGKKTIIIIAHRLSTVEQCDCIHIIENGRLADSGSFDELLERDNSFVRFAVSGDSI